MSLEPNAVILSIGAVQFNREGLGDEYYGILNVQSQIDKGRIISASTLKWWAAQSDDARKVLTAPQLGVSYALTEFGQWLEPDTRVWGNGASFDNVLLATLYSDFGIKKPWGYDKDRCYRTLKNIAAEAWHKPIPRFGTYHNALDDAKTQALHAIQLMEGEKWQ